MGLTWPPVPRTLFVFWSSKTFEDVRLLRVNIDRALIFGYDLHGHFIQLILKFGQYLQRNLFSVYIIKRFRRRRRRVKNREGEGAGGG